MRKFLLLVLLAALMPSVLVAQDDDTEANKALARRWITEMMAMNNPDIADEIVSPDFVNWAAPDLSGIEGAKVFVINAHVPYVDYSVTPLAMIAEGDYVTSVVLGGGTFIDDVESLFGVTPPNDSASWTLLVTHRIAEGRIIEISLAGDWLHYSQMMGWAPAADTVTIAAPWDVTFGECGTTPEENKALLMQAVEMWNAGDTHMIASIYTEDFTFHQPPSINSAPLNRDDTAEHIAALHNAFRGFTMELDTEMAGGVMIAEGNLVTMPYTWEGTFVGDFGGFQANRAQVICPGYDLIRIEDGRIAEHWHNWNTMCFAMAAMAPPPQSSTTQSRHDR